MSKKDFGHVLVIAGSAPMLGAAALVGLAAMRSGAGLVTCAIPSKLNLTLQKKLSPVVMTLPFKKFEDLQKHLHKFNVVAIGPGLGVSRFTKALVLRILKTVRVPIILDADALNIIAKSPKILLESKGIKILTPHVGEMSRLCKMSISDIQKNPKKVAFDFAHEYDCVLVLKGYRTIVVNPYNHVIYVNRTGNAGIATAGTGDVLTGMIAALLAQGVKNHHAAEFGVYWHGKAADKLLKKIKKASIIATDLIEAIPLV